MSRIPRPTPDQLDDSQRALYESITGGPRASGPQLFPLTDGDGRLEGPFNAMLLNPTIGTALQSVGEAIRYRGQLSDRAREIAILAVAAHWDSGFEQRAHEAVGRHVGLADTEITALRQGQDVPLEDAGEAAVLTVTRRLLERQKLDDDEYDHAVNTLGAATVFELTTLVGYYTTLAWQMRVFGVT